jgi:TLC domain
MIILAHDCNDVLLEAAKLFKYAGLEGAATAAFVSFLLSWVATRLTYYPLWILRSCRWAPMASRAQFAQFGSQNRAFGPHLTNNNRVLISVRMRRVGRSCVSSQLCRTGPESNWLLESVSHGPRVCS